MSQQLRTFTLSDAMGNPTHSLCRGHVSLETFRRAFEAEGWSGDVDEIHHQWWKRIMTAGGKPVERWEKTERLADGALPMTVTEW